MYLLFLSARDALQVTRTCRSVSWRVWCPVDIILWVVVAFVLALLTWKILCSKTMKRRYSDENRQIAGLRDDSDDLFKNNDNRVECPCGIPDPHHIVHSQESSGVSKNSLPTPPLALLADSPTKSSSGRLTGLGISLGPGSTSRIESEPRSISRQGNMPVDVSVDAADCGLQPPAYVCDVRTDQV